MILARPDLLLDSNNLEVFKAALSGTDRLRPAALAVLREMPSGRVLEALLDTWSELPPEAHVAMLDAGIRLGFAPFRPRGRRVGARCRGCGSPRGRRWRI